MNAQVKFPFHLRSMPFCETLILLCTPKGSSWHCTLGLAQLCSNNLPISLVYKSHICHLFTTYHGRRGELLDRSSATGPHCYERSVPRGVVTLLAPS